MGSGTITGHVDQTVILGTAAYSSGLLIESMGSVSPTDDGPAILVPAGVVGATIDNEGFVEGGRYDFPSHLLGGIGVEMLAAGTLTNSGTIFGGLAGFHGTGSGIPGPAGVELTAGGAFSNTGTVGGGTGGYSLGKLGGNGGTGVFLNAASFANEGSISGGDSGYSGNDGSGGGISGVGGIGVDLVNGSIGTNSGIITGGVESFDQYIYSGGAGGAGARLSHSALTNTGKILGGNGSADPSFSTGVGGAGVILTQGSILHDAAQISGGHGGSYFGVAGAGGAGVFVASDSLLTVTGTITGGAGGDSSRDQGGKGGAGVILTGGLVELTGTIKGGDGGTYQSQTSIVVGVGGAGVQINGGMVVDNGTIIGGGLDQHYSKAPGDAIFFGPKAGVLVLGREAVIDGRVAARAGAGDVLALAGRGLATLTGLGSTVTGFDRIDVNAGAIWDLAGASRLTAQEDVRDDGHLTLGGMLSGAGTITLDAGSVLTAAAGVSGVGVTFNGAASVVLDSVASFAGTLSGFAAGDIVDLAKLKVTSVDYKSGTLVLENGSVAVGSLAFAGQFSQGNFSVGTDGHGGSEVMFVATPDFGAGSHWLREAAVVGHGAAGLGMPEPDRPMVLGFLHDVVT